MAFLNCLKSTFFIWFLLVVACGNPTKTEKSTDEPTLVLTDTIVEKPIIVAANRTNAYLPLLKGKRVGIVGNQTTIIFKPSDDDNTDTPTPYIHLVDSLLSLKVDIKKVFAPEHGFRGIVDAGEKVKDGVDSKTGLPLISLYGKNRKPSAEQLKDIDVVLLPLLAFDEKGNRVGYGGGFYDRFIAQLPEKTQLIGLSLFEPVEEIKDLNTFDKRMQVCITPEEIYYFD